MKLREILDILNRAVEADPRILDEETYLRVGPTIMEINIKGEA